MNQALPPEVQIQLFGPFSLTLDGSPAAKASKSCQQLIALLVLSGENGLDRDLASHHLWPESPLSTARYYFRRTLTECRKLLGPYRSRLKTALPNQVKLSPAPWSDYDQFELLANSSALPDLLQAIEIAERDFVTGIQSSWCETQRLKIRARVRNVALECAKLYRREGNFSLALKLLARAVTVEPLDEELLIPFWEALVEVGQEDRFEESYRQTLDRYARSRLELSPRLVSGAKRLFRSERSVDPEPSTVLNRPAGHEDEPPFFGRTSELKQVAALLKSHRVVEVAGPPGIGTTRFLLEAAKAFPGPVIYASEGIAEDSIPAGRRCLLILDNQEVGQDQMKALLQTKPYLRVLSAAPTDSTVQIKLGGLFDTEAIDLLAFLLRPQSVRAEDAREVTDQLAGNPAALGLAADYARLVGVDEVLRQLEAAKPNDLLVTQIDRRITQKWLGDLTPAEREAVGDLAEIRQPFPLDLARHIVAEHVEGPAEEFIVRQLFGLGILIPEPEGLVKLNSLIRLTLAAPSRGVGGKIADYYLHLADSNPPLGLDLDLIGSSVTCLAESQPEKALKLLNWIGPSMSNSGMHDQLADLTHSFLPNLAPSPKTVTAWMNVGLGYHRAHKLGLAACEYRIALEAAEELNLEHTKMRCLLNLGDVESNSARLEDAELHLQQAAELARKLEDRSSEAFALRTMGYVERQRHENELGVQFTTKALALYTLIGDVPGRVWCIGCLASCYFEAGAYEQARSRFLESLAIQREIGDMHGVAWNLTYLGETCTYLGELKQGEAFVREALSLQTDPQLFHRLSWPLRILGENLVLQGDFKGAEATFCRSLDSVRDSGNKTGEALTLIRLAEVSQAAEEISTARAYLDLAQEIAASTQNPQIQAEVTRVAEKINSGKRTSSDY